MVHVPFAFQLPCSAYLLLQLLLNSAGSVDLLGAASSSLRHDSLGISLKRKVSIPQLHARESRALQQLHALKSMMSHEKV
jgi:hypothetical protein